ncbi:HAD family hydrolase [uncultured Enterovirga sp.]|uniref:HAD family hydrolase n=1 Tax=uncultured Enterovirga sp. TaxID=2026352 RepID=UPI0035C984BF
MLKAVIFDVDGTLIDTNDLHAAAWVEAFRHFGIEVPYEDVRRQMGKGGDQLMPVFLDPAVLERDGEKIETFRTDLFKREYLSKARAFPQVRALFERVKSAGQTSVLATSGKREEVDRHMTTAEITDLVDESTTSEDAESSKPKPDIFQSALKRIAPITADEAIVVGDTPYDAEAAGKAGLRTIGLLCGGFSEEDLRGAGCIAIYADPAALLRDYDRSPLAAD